jgi:molybdopterin converting factor small subunit
MTDITITMRLFGAFRKHGEHVTFAAPKGATAAEIKARLAQVVAEADPKLVHDSALANDDEILPDDAVLTADCRLAILPPVCGG